MIFMSDEPESGLHRSAGKSLSRVARDARAAVTSDDASVVISFLLRWLDCPFRGSPRALITIDVVSDRDKGVGSGTADLARHG